MGWVFALEISMELQMSGPLDDLIAIDTSQQIEAVFYEFTGSF
jgi:hypothetical protein